MKRRDFIRNCALGICCSVAAGCLLNNKKNNDTISDKDILNNPNFDLNPIILSIEIHLVEHCNLNCKYCWHFSNIAEESYYDVKQYEEDIKALSLALKGSKLRQFKMMGGEPLLHPQINDLVKITRKYLPDTIITICTNTLLLDYMDKSFWNTLAQNNVNIHPSLYVDDINWNSIMNKAKKYNVNFIDNWGAIYPNIDEPVNNVRFFSKLTLDLNGKQRVFRPDCSLNTCFNYKNGKLYRCFIPCYIEHFNKKFNKDLKVMEADYIDIYKINDAQDLSAHLQNWNSYYPFCRYCKDFSGYNIPWECSKEHDISEWT